ncbi:methyl-accepting chemotaxis protein [Paenibacillus alba]|uniref:Methyl-accepting chemotaxis protein n=1 Tax=Paenibacillus alba TaxID=1197127 RepID=A0ABU6G3L6_9BACL|nr:methyl-accepting chemotaxis protein [Paenibacillus alba]MEC0228756.1 methyl-accepting chemotaxis protein [Paenibacillus alba]NQX69052.1 cache domain-containing protein [Paenibacillus alba]
MIKLTIRRKLLLVSFLLLVVPIIALGLVTNKVSGDSTHALIETGLKNNVRLATEMLNSLDKAVQKGVITKEDAQNQLRVMLLGEKRADNTRPINTHIDLGKNGYFFIMDEKGNLLAHPLLEGQNIWDKQTTDGTHYIQNMIKTAQTGGGFTYYDWPLPNSKKEASKLTYSELSTSWGWIISAGSYMQDYDAGQRHILSAMLITLIVCSVVGITLFTFFALHISRPIIRVADQAERMAAGDLSGEQIVVSSRDETGQLASSFNTLSDSLRELAGNQLLSANVLAASSMTLSSIISETTQAVNQTSHAITEVAASNETQASSIEETSRAMEEMSTGIQRIAITSNTAFEASVGTLQEAENGNELSLRSTVQMTAVSSTVGDLSGVIHQLGDRSQQIGQIVEAIKEISAQTNLLALNASIEAARAGENGRGFAVVASEIRKLAERSNDSAAQVAELIEDIQNDIQYAVGSMQKGEHEVEASVAAIRETGEAFTRILQATRSVVMQVEETSAAAEQMSASSQEISAALQEMEQVSSNTAGAAQIVSAATEEQLASMEEIALSAQKLSQMSDQMKQLINNFKM